MAAAFAEASRDAWAASVFVAPREPTASVESVAAKLGEAGTVVGISAATVAETSFIVQLESADAVKAVVEKLDGKPLKEGGKNMRIIPAREPLKRSVVADAIFVRNLAREATKEEVRAVFEGVGAITKLRMLPRRGAAEITFAEASSVAPALAKSGAELHGRKFFVEQQERAERPAGEPKQPKAKAEKKPKAKKAAPTKQVEIVTEEAPADPRKVRLGNLAAGVSEDEIKAFVGPAGAVKKVKIVDSAKSGLHAFVVFEEAAGAEAAQTTLNGKAFNGANVVVEADKPRMRRRKKVVSAPAAGAAAAAAATEAEPAKPDPLRVWVGNLPQGVDKDVIADAFGKFGEVLRLQRRNKGARFCYITFKEPAGASAALAAGTTKVGENDVNIQSSTAPPPSKRVRSDRVRNVRPKRREGPTAEAAGKGEEA